MESPEFVLTRIKSAKNELIGNRQVKMHYFSQGLLQECMALLELPQDPEIYIQALAVIDSYVIDCDGVRSFLKSQSSFFPSLVRIIKDHSENYKVQDICLRTLRNSLLRGIIKVEDLLLQSNLMAVFPILMNTEIFALLIAEIVEFSASTPASRKKVFEQHELIVSLTNFLERRVSFDCEYAILKALSKLTTESEDLCKELMRKPNIFDVFERYVRHPEPTFARFPAGQQHLLRWILPTLTKTLKHSLIQTKIQSASVLTLLLENNPVFQKMAGDLGAVEELCDIIKSVSGSDKREEKGKKGQPMVDIESAVLPESELSSEQKLLQSSLNAIASLASSNEDLRKKIFDQGQHKTIMEFAKHFEPRIRAAACASIVSLARAEKFTKTLLISEGVLLVLQNLLYDKYLDVQIAAVGAVCNLALEFQAQICENEGCINRILDLLQSKHPTLRFRAVFALKNLTFKTTAELIKALISKLTFEKLLELIDDEDVTVQEQAICTMRNILHEKHDWANEAVSKIGIERILEKMGEKANSQIPGLIAQAIYLVCNVASLGEREKTVVMNSVLVKQCVSLLGNKSKLVKAAAISFVLNGLWKDDAEASNREKWKKVLEELGAQKMLKDLVNDADQEVREKAIQALRYFG